eukprot:2056396-Karenia_brevis.AAC.1
MEHANHTQRHCNAVIHATNCFVKKHRQAHDGLIDIAKRQDVSNVKCRGAAFADREKWKSPSTTHNVNTDGIKHRNVSPVCRSHKNNCSSATFVDMKKRGFLS